MPKILLQENIEIIGDFKFDFYRIIGQVFLLEEALIDMQKIKIQAKERPVAGNVISISQGTSMYQAEITTVNAFDEGKYEVILDMPLDKDFTGKAVAEIGDRNLASDGSVELSKFELMLNGLDDSVMLAVDRMIFNIEDVKEMDTDTFGGHARLKNGVVLRIAGGSPKNIMNIKSNKDFVLNSCQLDFTRKHPNEKYVVFAKKECSEIITDNKNNIELIIQDDLRTLEMYLTMHGHIIKNI